MIDAAVLEMTDVALSSSTSAPNMPCKRTRGSSEAENVQGKRVRQEILRPGIPPATPTNSFRVPDRPSPPLREDDKDGHYVYELGENLTSRYKILSKMGEGTFGRVLECWDRKHKDYVAIKIVRNIDKYRHAAMIELEVLNTLERNDPQGSKNCLSLREWFDYRGHVCMVFEKLGPSLFDFLRKNEYRPFPVDLVQDFARQLVLAVSFMHECKLVHTDLKPENILLVSLDYCRSTSVGASGRASATRVVPSSSAIKVIDFGSATFEDQYHSSIVSTRHYRAPEVIMGLGWSYPCDMWSVGCIIMELLTGDALFQTHENLEHLAMMEQVLGPLPEPMVGRANKLATKYFVKNKLCWPDGAANKKSVKAVKKLSNIRRLILEHGDSSAVPYLDTLVDLIQGMLRYDPDTRISAAQAMQHPFFSLKLAQSIPPAMPSPNILAPGQQAAGTDGCRVVVATAVQQAQSISGATPSVAPGLSTGLPLLVTAGRGSVAAGGGLGAGMGW
uniref:Protein kinase domain-containing protein n=1 Tax=Chlamydomonas leiostraca TaxID=1034604 RepID=A0A7S0S3R3_9CHLO|mmetsp:Transcript_690/g.1833  ORF Transcript_690/g.1833 Transcript_690/m.1833 type:complete len:502 (+) Transcript_690:92-1597(+)